MKTIEEFELLFYKAVESARTNEPVSIGFNRHLRSPLIELLGRAIGQDICKDAKAEEIRGGSGGHSTFAETTPESFDGSKVDTSKIDEFGQTGRIIFLPGETKPIHAFEAKTIADQYPLEDVVNEIMKEIKTAAYTGHHRIGLDVSRVPSRRRDEVWKYLEHMGYKLQTDEDTLTYIFISW